MALDATAGSSPVVRRPSITLSVPQTTVIQEMLFMTSATPTAGPVLDIRQAVLPECVAPVNAVSTSLQKSIGILSQSIQAINVSASGLRVSIGNDLATATSSISQLQSSASAALASASTDAIASISAAQSSASMSANTAIASVQSSASSSADAAVASVRASASSAMALVASSVSASAALAMASISLDRNSAASQVAQANQQANDSKLAALNATQTAFAVLGTIVGSSLISILVYWLVSRRRKQMRNRQKRGKSSSKAASIDAEEKKVTDSRPSTAASQDYPEEEIVTMPMALSVHSSWDLQNPPLRKSGRVSYFQPIEGVSPMPNFSNSPTNRTLSLKSGPSMPVMRQNSTDNVPRMSEVSRESTDSDVSEWSFVPAALGYQAALDESRDELREKRRDTKGRSKSLADAHIGAADTEEAPILLQAKSYVDLKSLEGSKKSKEKTKESKTEENDEEDGNEARHSKKSSIGTAI